MGTGRFVLEFANKPDHGGYEQAVYAYAREDLDWWVERLGCELANGTFGENITTSGLDVTGGLREGRRLSQQEGSDSRGETVGHRHLRWIDWPEASAQGRKITTPVLILAAIAAAGHQQMRPPAPPTWPRSSRK